MDFIKIVEKAQQSSFYLWLLNVGSSRMVPFNKPHGFRILNLASDRITTFIPYKRRNLNHVKGLHACAMATLSEYTTGVLLLYRLDPKKYRIILKALEMEYHYQGKMDATATFELTDAWLEENVIRPLANAEAVVIVCEVKIHDKENNHLSTAKAHWQLKAWDKVKTSR